jgi:hypothetical protein
MLPFYPLVTGGDPATDQYAEKAGERGGDNLKPSNLVRDRFHGGIYSLR